MTTYHIEHRTIYTYDSDVTGSYGLVHLRPRDLVWQTCVAHEITIDPDAIPALVEGSARSAAAADRAIGEAAVELIPRLHQRQTYNSDSRKFGTSVSDLQEKGAGVYRDFAHFMVGGLRSLVLAGRYVS